MDGNIHHSDRHRLGKWSIDTKYHGLRAPVGWDLISHRWDWRWSDIRSTSTHRLAFLFTRRHRDCSSLSIDFNGFQR